MFGVYEWYIPMIEDDILDIPHLYPVNMIGAIGVGVSDELPLGYPWFKRRG